MLPSDIASAVAVTFGLLVVLAGALRFFHRTAAPIEALRAYAVARGALIRGDGVVIALQIVGTLGTRRWTLGYHHPPGQPDVLLIGIDCAAVAGTPGHPIGLPRTVVDDEVLAVRLTTPPPDLYTTARLDALLASLADLAADLEVAQPADVEPE